MMEGIKEESVGYLFNVEVQVERRGSRPTAAELAVGAELVDKGRARRAEVPFTAGRPQVTAKGLVPARPLHLEYSAPSVDGEADVVHTRGGRRPGRRPPADADRAARRRAERAARKRGR